MPRDIAIILNNGRINAAVATALAGQKHRLVMVHVETADGGSRLRSAFEQQVAHFKPYRDHVLPMQFLGGLGGAAEPASTVDPRVPSSVTPQLVHLLPMVGMAARLAVHYAASAVYLGLRVGSATDDLVQATEYGQVWQELLQMTCGQPELELLMPLLELEPWQVVDVGTNVATPFDRAWSCDESGNEPCWACRGCRAREAAFQQAAKPDPLRSTTTVARR